MNNHGNNYVRTTRWGIFNVDNHLCNRNYQCVVFVQRVEDATLFKSEQFAKEYVTQYQLKDVTIKPVLVEYTYD